MDIVHKIPWQLSNFGGTGVGGSYALQDYEFDYAIGGIPFLSATRDQYPYTEGMAEIRKQQFDSFAEPGEQSLYGWWLRSQSTFDGGAGILYQDPDTDNQFNFRFADSLGIDNWSPGELQLLRRSNARATGLASPVNLVRGYVTSAGVDAAWYTDGNLLWKITDAAIVSAGASTPAAILGLASTGDRFLELKTSGVWSGTDAGAATQLVTFTCTTGAIEFAKSRIVYGRDNVLASSPIASPAETIIFTHPNVNWQWTSITEGPSAIYAAGNDGTTGAIYKATLDATGAVPSVSFVTTTAIMPSGEKINTIYGYIGSFVGIATSKGFRVGEIDANGDIQYGPLLFTPTGGCSGITGFDRFMWTGSTNSHDGQSGLFRVDLGNTIQVQTTHAVRYAYSRDIYAEGRTGAIRSVGMFGGTDRKIYSVSNDAILLEQATELVPEGYLNTGRIRFNTEEPKLYKFFSIRTPTPLQGDVQVSLIDQTGSEILYITYTPSFVPGTRDVATPQPNGPQNWVAFKFTLKRGADPAFGGILNGWQVKALPGSIRQRIITHTWLCFDEETDKGGQRVGTDGYARQRLQDFQALARAGDVIVFQELADNESTLVVIDDWRFTQLAPPGPNGGAQGGYLTAVLRTVAEST